MISGTVWGTYRQRVTKGKGVGLCYRTYPQRADDINMNCIEYYIACISSQLVSNLPWKSIPLQQILPLPEKLLQRKWSAIAKPNGSGLPARSSCLPAGTLCPRTMSQCGQGDAAKCPQCSNHTQEVSQQPQSWFLGMRVDFPSLFNTLLLPVLTAPCGPKNTRKGF